MKDLWQRRLLQHWRNQSKYLRLVFNEYFILALIFIIGAVGFWYSQALQHLTQPVWWCRPVAIILMSISVLAFKLATLIQPADATFLLPQEKNLQLYLCLARNYSLVLPIIGISLVGFFLSPFLAQGANLQLPVIVGWVIIALGSGLWSVNNQLTLMYQFTTSGHWLNVLLVWFVLSLGLYVPIYWVYVLLLAALVASGYYQRQILRQRPLNWQRLVDEETHRSYQLKRFYNLFTDVPGLTGKVRQRSIFNWLLQKIKPVHNNTYLYLFARGLLRNSDYSNLFLRLVVVELLLIYAIHQLWLITVLTALFLYLVEFQLLPLYKNYDGNALLKIYPLQKTQKFANFKKLLLFSLSSQWCCSSVALVLFNRGQKLIFIPVIVNLMMVWGLIYIYLPRQIKNINS